MGSTKLQINIKAGFITDFGFQINLAIYQDFRLTSGFDKKHNLNYF